MYRRAFRTSPESATHRRARASRKQARILVAVASGQQKLALHHGAGGVTMAPSQERWACPCGVSHNYAWRVVCRGCGGRRDTSARPAWPAQNGKGRHPWSGGGRGQLAQQQAANAAWAFGLPPWMDQRLSAPAFIAAPAAKEDDEIAKLSTQLAIMEQTKLVWSKQKLDTTMLDKQVEELRAWRDQKRADTRTPSQAARALRIKLEKEERKQRVAQEAADKAKADIVKLQELRVKKQQEADEAKAAADKIRKELDEKAGAVDVEDVDLWVGLPEEFKDKEGFAQLGEELKKAQNVFADRVKKELDAHESSDGSKEGSRSADGDLDMADGGGERGGGVQATVSAAEAKAAVDEAVAAEAAKHKIIRPSLWLEEDDVRQLLLQFGAEINESNINAARQHLDAASDHASKKQRV